jgi:NADPH-dependent 2,4-dienoyl-CoA reductase/sulfur reductase-like enzyme
MRPPRPLIIVGGGKAGMAAAIETARAGLDSTLIDESPRLDGHDARTLRADFDRGEHLRQEFREVADRVELRLGTSVLGISGEREVLWAGGGASGTLRAEQLVLATGKYDRPIPFPGWTLPGVMTAGGVQALLETKRLPPGRRALLAGTGLHLLRLAHRLLASGVEIVSVLEAGTPQWAAGAFPRDWGFLHDASESREVLSRAGIPVLFGHTVFAAYGRDGVGSVSYGPVDPGDWRPQKERAKTVEADLLVVGFGFVSNTELSVLAGCRQQYLHQAGGWVPVRDRLMQTTVPGVSAVGVGAGIAGDLVAEEEGRIAGITAAERAGAMTAKGAADRRAGPLARLRSLAEVCAALDEVSRIRPGLLDLADPDTLMCPCEKVRLGEVQQALCEGACDLQAVKLLTRLGMGVCQGRSCGPSTGMFLCRAIGRTPEEVGRINPRPPVRPVTLGVLARLGGVTSSMLADPQDAADGDAS